MSTLGTISGRDNLIAGDFPIVTDGVTIVTGETLVRGSLLGKVTATGKYKLSLSAAVDGSQTPVAIASEAVDASAADVITTVYKSGEFNQNQITFGTGHTAASVKAALRALCIFLNDAIQA